MSGLSILRLLLAAGLLGLVLARGRQGPIPVLLLEEPAQRPASVARSAALEPDFAAHMTPDDVVRGAWALADGMGPGLARTQVEPLLQAARTARQARQEVDRLRLERRQARDALRQSGLQLTQALLEAGWEPGGAAP